MGMLNQHFIDFLSHRNYTIRRISDNEIFIVKAEGEAYVGCFIECSGNHDVIVTNHPVEKRPSDIDALIKDYKKNSKHKICGDAIDLPTPLISQFDLASGVKSRKSRRRKPNRKTKKRRKGRK